MKTPTLAAIASLTIAIGPVAAQEGPTWELSVDEARDISAATMIYEGGQGLIVQCRDKQLRTVIIGLPTLTQPPERRGRRIETSFGTEPLKPETWIADDGSSAVTSVAPARVARSWKRGGLYTVRARPAPGERASRIGFELPTDGSPIDHVLTHCGYPTEDTRDQLPMVDGWAQPGWAIEHLDVLPSGDRTGQSWLSYSCIVAPDMRLHECKVEAESNPSRGMGDALRRSERLAVVRYDGAPDALVGHIYYATTDIVVNREMIM